jgi:hypothetical protein
MAGKSGYFGTHAKSVDITLPELTGVRGGTGCLDGDGGLGIGFTLGEINLIGGSKGTRKEKSGDRCQLAELRGPQKEGFIQLS